MIPIKITSFKITKELSTATVNWLLGNVGDKLKIETEFTVQNYAIGTMDEPLVLNATDGLIGNGWVTGLNEQFGGFNIGDTVILFNKDYSTYKSMSIIDKLDNNNIQMNATIDTCCSPYPNQQGTNFIISNTTPITAIKLHYNFIENEEADTFKSAYDDSEQLLTANVVSASDTTTTIDMVFMGAKTYQSGSATIIGKGIETGTSDGLYKSKFKITQWITIPPFLKYNEVDDYIAGIVPINYRADKSTKFIYQIEAAELYTNPNFLVSEIFSSVKGNVGFFDENYNTGITNYSISDLKYFNNGLPVTEAQFDTSETSFSFIINNTSSTPFSNNNTKFVLGFAKVPTEEAEYILNGNTLDQNYCFDRAVQTVGSAAVNGGNYATNYKVFKTITGTYLSTSQIRIDGIINFGSSTIERFTDSDSPRYMLFVSVQKHTLDTNNATNDLVTLKVDFNTLAINTTDDTMILSDATFLRHPETDPDTEGVSLDLSRNSLSVDKTTTMSNVGIWMQYNSVNKYIYVCDNTSYVRVYDKDLNLITSIHLV